MAYLPAQRRQWRPVRINAASPAKFRKLMTGFVISWMVFILSKFCVNYLEVVPSILTKLPGPTE